ncbi:MAG: PEGA domain-containing protein [Kofleriaceae bacterium]
MLACATTALAQSSRAAATIQFDQGRALMKQKKYKQACAAFENSQKLDPQMGTQFNLAECQSHMGMVATAWLAYRELGQRDNMAGRKMEANRRAKELEKRLPKLLVKLASPPAGLVVKINNMDSTALLGIESPVDLGEYEIHATAPGYAPFEATATVSTEGKTVKVTVELEESEGTPDPGLTTKPKKTTKVVTGPVDEPASTSHRKRNGAILGIAGGVAIAGGMVFGLSARGKWSDAEALCPDHACPNANAKEQGDELVDSARTNATYATALVLGGAALTAVGIYFVATAKPSSGTALRVTPTQGGAAVVFGGRF